jgi:hypothetical protein
MDPRSTATRVPDPDAVEFIRFCYGRRRVGWPELYDEMCAVAARGLFRGLGPDDLAAHGIGFCLHDMPALAALAAHVVAQEHARRRPVAVVITPLDEEVGQETHTTEDGTEALVESDPVASRADAPVRLMAMPAGA